jgi:hypothetical protein
VTGPARRLIVGFGFADLEPRDALGRGARNLDQHAVGENFLYSVKAARFARRKPGLRAALGRRPRPGSNRERRRFGLTGNAPIAVVLCAASLEAAPDPRQGRLRRRFAIFDP